MDKECNERLEEITSKFKKCGEAISAIGDETRQLILLTLLESDFNGVRVGIINLRREGTKNYYYLDSNESQWKDIKDLINLIFEGIQHISEDDRRKEE